jgi:hypothetical protein
VLAGRSFKFYNSTTNSGVVDDCITPRFFHWCLSIGRARMPGT